MKTGIYLDEDGIPTVKSEEGVLLVDEEGVVQFKRKGSVDLLSRALPLLAQVDRSIAAKTGRPYNYRTSAQKRQVR